LGRNDEVRAAATDAIAAWHALPGKRARWVEAALYRILGRGEGRAGHYEASIAAYQVAQMIAASEFGEDALLVIRAQGSRASSLEELGRLGEARALRENVLALSRR